MMTRRSFALLALAAGLSAAAPVLAADFPSQPLRWVVPFPPGGAMDVIARTMSESVSRTLGQPVVVENRSGAGGNIGAAYAAGAPADGHTIMIAANGMAVNPALYSNLTYDPIQSFAPISLLAIVPNILVANPQRSPAKTVQEVIDLAKQKPGHYTYASAGVGTSIHLAGELFVSMSGVDMLHVPYKGSGPAVADLLGGQVDYMFDSITSAKPHVDAGRLNAIAVTTEKRSSAMPNLPTVAESGLPGYNLSPWFGVFAPAGTPQPVLDTLHAAMMKALEEPRVQETLASIGAERIGSTPDALRDHLAEETAQWKTIVAERGIKAM
ncbi:tripartite tricarboxylate transporter substrate binding protein [Achromobacter sp. GG226]|uniref:Bug family tripartite tricarboxylate transporter substrate binding protein n=1 Tax=Verticiella alkaliphila TaxID=2779529 RepID=UPI001C0B9BD6|nr:tripartite tricarboxylate transporter substrate binding protein [Verticiella sp. GG226]MBU4611625.1 tripartite tricarboxylate transporter substrate binding protein [Verticiella sp. GG226]